MIRAALRHWQIMAAVTDGKGPVRCAVPNCHKAYGGSAGLVRPAEGGPLVCADHLTGEQLTAALRAHTDRIQPRPGLDRIRQQIRASAAPTAEDTSTKR